LHFYRGEIPIDRYLRLLDAVPALEVRNGTMAEAHNALLEAIAQSFPQGVGNRFDGIDPKRFLTPCGKFAITAGSDAHTLRRVGTTWTEAPGRTRDEFLDSVRNRQGVPGGAHGTTTTIAAEAYGVTASSVAALAGFGPRDLSPLRHAACLAFAVVSLPFQFLPLLIAARSKAGERRAVEQLTAHLARVERTPHGETPQAEPVEREPFTHASTTSV